jgi:outer membrane receptor protein involved in Fe transport
MNPFGKCISRESSPIKIGLCVLLFICLLWVSSGTGLAQSSTATINGTVKDSSGSIVPAAEVVLTNTQTGVERKVVTNDVGAYAFLNIIPGEYRLQAGKTGFKTSKQSAFTLTVNQTATFDLSLEVGEISQEVTVEAVGAELQSSTAELGAVVAKQQVVDLPLNGRNFTQLLSLTPGVAPVSVSQNSGGFGASATSGAAIQFPAINGQNNRSNFFLLDGINNQGSFTSTYAVPPIIDTIQEFKVQSHNDQAEFGGALGGIINVVTKSGTNEIHGSAWEFLRNNVLDARNPFLLTKTPFRQNQYGAAGGGPIIKNKTFFYGGWQGFKYRRDAETLFRVPTEANLRGDFSDEPRQIYNPFTTRPNPNGAGFIRDLFPGNIIPTNLINAGMVAFARATLPAPVFTGVANRNARDTTPFVQDQNEWTVRVDHILSEKDSVWFRYSAFALDGSRSGGRPALQALDENAGKNWALSWVRTFSPTLVVQAQYGRVHLRVDTVQRFVNAPADFDKQIGFADTFARNFQAETSTLVPAIGVSGFFGGGESNSLNPNMSDIHQVKTNVSKIVGNHTFKFGGELNSNNFEAFYNSANVGFNVPQTANPLTGLGGSEAASWLLNLPDSAGRRNVHETMRWGGVAGYYFMDSWKATSRLTVNLGLRYDRTYQPPYGRDDSRGVNGGIETGAYDLQRGKYILQVPVPFCSARGKAPCIPGTALPQHVEISPTGKIYKDTKDNWQPRVGLAYRLGQNTALRGSFQMFYDNWAGVTQTAQNFEGGWPDVAQQLGNNLNNQLATDGPLPNRTGTNPFPEGLFPAPTPFNQVLWYMDPNHKNPYSIQWNLGVQHQLNSSTVVTANYVGSGSRRLFIGGYYNTAVTPGPGDPRARSPFPYIAPTFYDRSWGRSNYHAFQFLLDKKFSNGLAYMVSYTWSKAIDIASSGWYGVEGHSAQDPYNINADRSVAGFDLPHVLTVNWVYQLPFGPGQRWKPSSNVLSHIIGNWQVNGIVLLHSGVPFNLTVPGDGANTGNNGYLRPSYVGGETTLSNPTPAKWFNTGAFAVPAQFTYGSAGRHILRRDGMENLDFSIFRQFPIMDTRRLEFRAEMFNALNNVVYGTPNGNITSADFGRVTGIAKQPRQIQLALKFIF